LWKYYNYHDLGIEVEPYFDIDFEKILYLTDTGRRWDGSNVSIRDKGLIKKTTPSSDSYSEWKIKPIAGSLMDMKQKSINFQKKFAMRSTFEIIKNAEREKLQNKIMMTFHPQRWNDQTGPWAKELIWQNVKNLGKYFFVKLRS
jgi:hypothetical protein